MGREQAADVCGGMPVSGRAAWDFGGLATERHKQPVSPVAVILFSPLQVMRGCYHKPNSWASPDVGLLGANSKDDHETTCHVPDELVIISGCGYKTFLQISIQAV